MDRPFPGMDPYLEAQGYWPDFHLTFLNYCREAIADHLPDAYEARIDERISLVEPPGLPTRAIEPDIALVRQGRPPRTRGGAAGAVAVADEPGLGLEPVRLTLSRLEEVRQRRIAILRRPDRALVTVLELLSPANKRGYGHQDYLAKREALLTQEVSLVEVDLLLKGRRLPLLEPLPPGDFYALVARADQRPDCQVYAWTLRNPLPTIPIPLKPPDPDVRLALAAVFATVYERARYGRSIDYRVGLSALGAEENRRVEAWAQAQAQEPPPPAATAT